MEDSHRHKVAKVLEHFKVDPTVGLNERTVKEQFAKHGPNGITLVFGTG